MTTTVTTSSGSGVATHVIDFKGLSGAIFWCLIAALIIYVLGFATASWSVISSGGANVKYGLWEQCTCTNNFPPSEQDWYKSTQAMITIGLILLCFALIMTAVYMFIHSFSKNLVLLLIVLFCFAAVLFMFIGFVVFGAYVAKPQYDYMGNPHWSYAFAVIGAFFCLVAGILAVLQMRKTKTTA